MLANALEGLVAVADGNLSVLVTGDKRSDDAICVRVHRKDGPAKGQRDGVAGFCQHARVRRDYNFRGQRESARGCGGDEARREKGWVENVFIAAFVKEDAEEEEGGRGGGRRGGREMRAALESVRSRDSVVMPSVVYADERRR